MPINTIYEIDDNRSKILKANMAVNEDYNHGFPQWLLGHNIQLIIVGNIGDKAINKLKIQNIEVVAGAKYQPSSELVSDYLKGDLLTTEVKCNHMGCQHKNIQSTCEL